MTLREGHREFADRLERTRRYQDVSDESSAERMTEALHTTGAESFVFIRTEYAKKRSSVIYASFEVRVKTDRPELSVFSLMSGDGQTYCGWLKYKVSQHALERVQQRRVGTVYKTSTFIDEFAPSLVMAYAEGTVRGAESKFIDREALLPTATGALISAHDSEWQGRVAVTWLAEEQLGADQVTERQAGYQAVTAYLELMKKGQRRKTFAGRNDRIELRLRESLARSLAIMQPNPALQPTR